ncbi:ABC transporter permease [Candidatus Woesearchaeota archaeon]|nr:ABC transporter permease [Candidatus Woesearchaeota archaeon]
MKLKNHFHLIREFTINNFKLKYKNSSVAYLWSILTPLLMLATLYIVFSIIMKLDVPHYQLFLLIGIIFWNFLSEATTTSMNSLLAHGNIIKKMNFPNYVVVVSSCLSSFVTLLLNLIIFFLFTLIFNVKLTAIAIILPFYLIELFILVLGISFFLSAFYPKFRDLSHIWTFLLLIGFWVTPIIYKETIVPEKYLKYYMLNQLARLINEARDILIYHYTPTLKQVLITLIICVLIFALGFLFFRKKSPYFAEEL